MNIVKVAAAPDISNERDGKTVVVSAVVPLTREFSYLIRKNSNITLSKKAFIVGEEGVIRVSLRGGEREMLKHHRITLRIYNVHEELVVSFSGETDSFGAASFPIRLTEQFFGENTIQVADMTYGEPIFLMVEPSFIVYETQDAKEKAENNMGQETPGGQLTGEGLFFGSVAQNDDSFYQKSVTIAVCRSLEACSRAGPS